jgi:hypothetical protein
MPRDAPAACKALMLTPPLGLGCVAVFLRLNAASS